MHAPEASLYHSILIICVVLGCIIGFFIASMIRQHRKNIEMYKSKLSAEITTLEKERARIAADLHDDLGPMLSAIKFKVSSVDVSGEDEKTLEDAQGYIDDVIQKMRMISNDMLPSTLKRKGLVFAVQEFIKRVQPAAMDISLTSKDIPPMHTELCVNLFRIIQEIIHNAIKHSGALKMGINLTCIDNRLELVCADNGKGFDQNKAQREAAGLGLRNVWSRAELLKGDVFLESAPGKGTVYTIELPVQKKTA